MCVTIFVCGSTTTRSTCPTCSPVAVKTPAFCLNCKLISIAVLAFYRKLCSTPATPVDDAGRRSDFTASGDLRPPHDRTAASPHTVEKATQRYLLLMPSSLGRVDVLPL